MGKTNLTFSVALVGNPNTGKSTLFNALCGRKQHIANYPGSTVEKKTGEFYCGDVEIHITDLPGSYSLKAHSPEEKITAMALLSESFERFDLILFLADATNLKRNLYLYTQIAQLGYPTAIVLTMIDLAKKKGMEIDAEKLSQNLQVPVVCVNLRNSSDILFLKDKICEWQKNLPPKAFIQFPEQVEKELAEKNFSTKQVDFALFDTILTPERAAALRYQWISEKLKDAIKTKLNQSAIYTDKIDKVLTHPVFGLLIFSGVMFVMFQAIYFWASPLMDLIEFIFGSFANFIGVPLKNFPILQSLVVDGVIQGVGSVFVFLPQIIFLFLFIALLEDSGYLSRAAFLMDRLLGWSGLNGKAFVPMLSSFACAIPGVLATRTIAEPKERLATILVSPLMSCSSRLPLYWVLISAFIEPYYGKFWAAFAFVAVHALGPLIALPVAYLLTKGFLRKSPSSFLLEMPDYRLPRLINVYYKIKTATLKFITTAGTIILFFSIVIWFLSYFPRPEKNSEIYQSWQKGILLEMPKNLSFQEQEIWLKKKEKAFYLEQSYLGRLGKAVWPIFAPLGFDWKISVGILGAFPARELIISTLGIIYQVGEDVGEETQISLREILPKETKSDGSLVFTPLVAISLLVFFALSAQCMSTIATVKKELNSWGWAIFLFSYMTLLAYLLSLTIYQVGLYLNTL